MFRMWCFKSVRKWSVGTRTAGLYLIRTRLGTHILEISGLSSRDYILHVDTALLTTLESNIEAFITWPDVNEGTQMHGLVYEFPSV